MKVLASKLRGDLEKTTKKARNIAEIGARKALEALAVHEPDPYKHMSETQRDLRRKLRAQARQLGDGESHIKRGAYEIKHLVEKIAYDQWHRLLFARFLLENNLLISPEHGVSVSLEDCEELASSLGLKDAWAVAARFAAVELPEIFRADDAAGTIELPIEDRNQLVSLLKELPVEVFTASDSLGWCYQFWQAERKDQVNAAGNKIGADELPAVTQLFTEDYMVDFLLDNTLGAWRVGRVLAANPKLAENAKSEEELRQAVALPGCPWKYLRFIKGKEGKWTPAAGTFDGWPKTAKEITYLDPCMGSGHFVVAMFERLMALRMAEEKLDEAAVVTAVIRDNLFGLEIDPRCTQIGAFNLALAAWRRVGHCKLPAMNLACSGLAPNTREADWLAIAGDNQKLRSGMERLYRLFQKAAVLGSLINPRAGESDLLVSAFHELQPLLEKALAQGTRDDTAHETAVTARGLAKAAEILAGQFTLVATNVPYLGRSKQDEVLQDYCERFHPEAKADLATCFVERCLDFCAVSGSASLVTPQNWLFLEHYKRLRRNLLTAKEWNCVARLGENGFESAQAAGAFVALMTITQIKPGISHRFLSIDATAEKSPAGKATCILSFPLSLAQQNTQLSNPDCRLELGAESASSSAKRLSEFVSLHEGMSRGDTEKFDRAFWELPLLTRNWSWLLNSPSLTTEFHGREYVINWQNGAGELANSEGARITGYKAWGKRGVFVARSRDLRSTLSTGEIHAQNGAVLLPHKIEHLVPIWCFCESRKFYQAVRNIDQKIIVASGAFLSARFDLAHWRKVAAEKYPHGLPKPFSSDPTQWLFNGHPKGADQPLHVAVARLLGYQWPRQTGSSFPDCPALSPDGLETLADDDGIVCISPIKGEAAAAERLRELLARAYGKDWNATRQEELLAQVDYAGASLEDWLRNGFFEQHCALFHHRPFIWHIWDGIKNGFSALVNYHKLTHANLEKLTYSYLGDWIRRQQAAVQAEEAGSDAKLQAAKQLQAMLKLILEGEPPYDIFVRWKPLSKQSIGWHPDLNDGVRMNIRPFAMADILRKRVKIKWDKDRGKEPQRDKAEYPWFWCAEEPGTDPKSGKDPDGNRWNKVHLTKTNKEKARK